MFARSSVWWQARRLADPELGRRGIGDLQCAVLEHEGRPAASALYRINLVSGPHTDSPAEEEGFEPSVPPPAMLKLSRHAREPAHGLHVPFSGFVQAHTSGESR